MKKQNEELADTFNRLDNIQKCKDVPNQGYVREFAGAEQRGREQIARDAELRGERSFPPAKEVTPVIASEDVIGD